LTTSAAQPVFCVTVTVTATVSEALVLRPLY